MLKTLKTLHIAVALVDSIVTSCGRYYPATRVVDSWPVAMHGDGRADVCRACFIRSRRAGRWRYESEMFVLLRAR